jgi:deglycase
MAGLTGLSVGIIAADGVEQVEVTDPRDALRRAGADVRVLSPDGRDVRGYHYIEPGDMLGADGPIAGAEGLDVLILPGGLGGPDTLRKSAAAVRLVRDTAQAGKPIGVICHGPWLLIDAEVLAGRTLTCVPQLSADVVNAGARYVDEDVHVDGGGFLLISSRDHNTAGAFAEALVRELARAA